MNQIWIYIFVYNIISDSTVIIV